MRIKKGDVWEAYMDDEYALVYSFEVLAELKNGAVAAIKLPIGKSFKFPEHYKSHNSIYLFDRDGVSFDKKGECQFVFDLRSSTKKTLFRGRKNQK